MSTFTYSHEYALGWARTDRPNVVAVIQRDDDAQAPDGDAYAPTLYGSGWGRRHYGDHASVFVDDTVTAAFLAACNRWDVSPHSAHYDEGGIVARYMRAFYGTRFYTASSSIDRYANVVVFDTPAWREHVGITPETVFTADDLTAEWKAYLDGEVYGVGWAIVPDDWDEDTDSLNPEIECWGFYGEDYAKETALAFDHGGPTQEQVDDWLHPPTPTVLPFAPDDYVTIGHVMSRVGDNHLREILAEVHRGLMRGKSARVVIEP